MGCQWLWIGLVEFNLFMETLGLRDLLLVGSKYAFFESGLGNARSRLDRFLVRGSGSKWVEKMIQ